MIELRKEEKSINLDMTTCSSQYEDFLLHGKSFKQLSKVVLLHNMRENFLKQSNKILWQKYNTMSKCELNFASLIMQSKMRCAAYLASQHSFWTEMNFQINGWPELQTLARLQHAYDIPNGQNTNEELNLAELFQAPVETFPTVVEHIYTPVRAGI